MVAIESMTEADIPACRELWERCEGVGLTEADSPESLTRYLARNPAMSFVARADGQLVGAVLCGHDGQRGYLRHLAVTESRRLNGIGRALVEYGLSALRAERIQKCHIFVYAENSAGAAFWERLGWYARSDIRLMSKALTPGG